MRAVKSLFAASLLLVLGGCTTATYKPPVIGADESSFSRVIDRPFDETWNHLIQHAAGSFFGIDNYEKDSGLITITFGAGTPSTFITGGHWKLVSPGANFEGDYVDYLSERYGADLVGRLNIVVIPMNEKQTMVKVNGRYVFTATPEQWVFDSGGSATVIISTPTSGVGTKERTIAPTYFVERTILDAVEELGRE